MSPLYAVEWRNTLQCFPSHVRATVQQLVCEQSAWLAAHFYQAMLEDEAAKVFLSHDQVKTRLEPSMQIWLQEVYALNPEADLEKLALRQVKIGEIHARIDLPVYLVLRGASRVKEGICQLLTDQPLLKADEQQAAIQLITRVMDLAMEVMAQAYASSRERNLRSKEAYRLFALTHNVATLRERRRAELLDWQNQCLYSHALSAASMPKLGSSDFGLWFRHKGAHIFQGLAETAHILSTIDHIDSHVLPAFEQVSPQQAPQHLNALREKTRAISLSLEALFEYNSQMDAGRDALTQLLNRKFLPVVLSKEIAMARESGTVFSVLTLDIDYFKHVNDRWGHASGDAVLQQIAALLSDNSRGGDYVFRLGGEEFLLLLVDTSLVAALHVAEKMRTHVEKMVFNVTQQDQLSLTVSVGVASFDGHPDYQQVLRRSDEALYAAKARGRNCVASTEDVLLG